MTDLCWLGKRFIFLQRTKAALPFSVKVALVNGPLHGLVSYLTLNPYSKFPLNIYDIATHSILGHLFFEQRATTIARQDAKIR
jgi:hypothetical protein